MASTGSKAVPAATLPSIANSFPLGPKGHFFGLNHVRHMRRDLLDFLIQQTRDHGDIVAYRCGAVPMFQFTHPDQIQEILVKQARKFQKPARVKNVFGQWDGQGLFTSDGELWIRQRRLIQQAFHPNRIRSHAASIINDAQRMLDRWRSIGEVNVVDEMLRLTLEITGHALFGTDLDADAPAIAAAADALQEVAMIESGRIVPLPAWLPVRIHRRRRWATRIIHGLIDRLIRQRRASGSPSMTDHPDLLSLLLAAVDTEGDGHGMSDQQARDEATTLLLAGHETTAVALMWTLYYLALHQPIQQQLADRVRQLLAGRSPTADDLPQLAPVEMAFKEAMRLRGPVYFFARESIEEVEIAGVRIPRGSQVHLVPYVTHHDPRWWDKPEEFRPDHFMPEREQARPQFAYFPFGGGSRVCIGKGLAMMEGTLILATILSRYHFTLAPHQSDPGLEALVSLHPRGPLRLALRKRN